MAAAERGLPVHETQYHRKLPEWILDSDDYDHIISKYRVAPRILQVACRRGDVGDADGCLFRFLVGVKFKSWVPCVNSTLWRSIDILEARGFVVCLSRGGSVYVSGVHENWASSFGIPIVKGSLDHRRVRRCKFYIVEDEFGKKHRKMIRVGDQITFYDRYKSFRKTAIKPSPKPSDLVRSSNYPSSMIELPVVRSSNTKHHGVTTKTTTTTTKTMGVSAKQGFTLGKLQTEDLRSVGRLREIYCRYVDAGFMPDSDDAFLRFVTMAQYAIRKGNEPVSLFSSNLYKRRFNRVTNQDEDVATRMIKDFFYPDSNADREDERRSHRSEYDVPPEPFV